ncbi:MAG: energy transducer TonB [Burkholderiaceae bacterium]
MAAARGSTMILGGWSWRDPLLRGVVFSLLLHLLVLVVRFAPPEALRIAPLDSRLEVILLNAKTESRPVKPDAVAQVDMEAGGEHERGRATSPLKAENRVVDGEAIVEQQKRVAQLEDMQRKLMTRAKQSSVLRSSQAPREVGDVKGHEATETQRAIARLQAQIDQQISDYNKRPRRLTYGVNAIGVSYARYVTDWATRIERIGTERYPREARGRLYDSMIITVEIDKNGRVVDVIVNKKSRFDVLNRAVKAIVHAGAPYERFPPEMAREGDILQIVRTWTFTNGALRTSALKPGTIGTREKR